MWDNGHISKQSGMDGKGGYVNPYPLINESGKIIEHPVDIFYIISDNESSFGER